MKSILLDVDSTVYPLLWAMNSLPGGERITYEDTLTWEMLADLSGGVESMLGLFAQAMDYSTMRKFAAFEGAPEVLQAAYTSGTAIHVATDRHPKYAEGTVQWLEDCGIPVTSLRCERGFDKLLHAREVEAELILDDHPELIARAHAEGMPIASLLWPYNRDSIQTAGAVHATNWLELGRLLDLGQKQITKLAA